MQEKKQPYQRVLNGMSRVILGVLGLVGILVAFLVISNQDGYVDSSKVGGIIMIAAIVVGFRLLGKLLKPNDDITR